MSRYGTVFRVDLGLRPEGNKGPLVLSVGGLRDYYQHRGQLWERQALLRARPVAGTQRISSTGHAGSQRLRLSVAERA